MAQILLLTQFFPPETGAAAKRLEALTRVLSDRHEVSVVTLLPSYPSPSLFADIDINRFDSQYDFNIKRTFSFQPYSTNLLFRGFREVLMSFRLLFHALSYPADIVLVSTPSMFLGPFAWILAKVKHAQIIWDVRDLTWRYGGQSVDAPRIQSAMMFLIEAGMKFFLRRTDLVVGATPGVSQLLTAEHDVPEKRNITILNGVSRSFMDEFEQISGDVHERPRVTYVGLLGNNHGISVLVDVAREMPELDFIIVGGGPEEALIKEKLKETQIDNFHLLGYCINPAELIRFYQDADLLINHTKDRSVLNRTVVPAKFSEYMTTGKPFVYAGKGIAIQFLDEVGCAVLTQSEDPAAIINAIRWVTDHMEEARIMGQRGREYVGAHLVREDLMERYVDEIEDHLLNPISSTTGREHSDKVS